MSFILHNDSWGWDWRFSTVWSKAARSPCCWLSTLSVDYAMALYPFIVVPLSLTVSGLGSPKPLHISEMWGESCSGFLGKEKRLFLLSFSFSFFPFSPFQHEQPIPWIQLAAFLSPWGRLPWGPREHRAEEKRTELRNSHGALARLLLGLNLLPLGRKWQWCLLLPSLAPKMAHAVSLPSLISCCLAECRGSSGRPCRGRKAGFHNHWATDLLGTGPQSQRWVASRQETKALSVFTATPLSLLYCLSSSCQISGSTGVS